MLSLGCGCGSIDKYIIEKKNTLYCGIDNSQNMLIDLIKTNSDKKFILIKEDLKYFNIDKVKIKFDLVLLLGILPFFNNQHIKSILKKIYDATHPGALVVFNIDTNGFRWFENYPRAHEAYSNIFIKRIFSDFNKKKNNFKIKSRKIKRIRTYPIHGRMSFIFKLFLFLFIRIVAKRDKEKKYINNILALINIFICLFNDNLLLSYYT